MYNNINVERARFKMSVEELCGKIGIARKTYYNWQDNGDIPSTKLIAMADLFNCSTDYLLGRDQQ